MARLDRVKNLTGLAEWYGRSARLRSLANLVIVGGIVDPALTQVPFPTLEGLFSSTKPLTQPSRTLTQHPEAPSRRMLQDSGMGRSEDPAPDAGAAA